MKKILIFALALFASASTAKAHENEDVTVVVKSGFLGLNRTVYRVNKDCQACACSVVKENCKPCSEKEAALPVVKIYTVNCGNCKIVSKVLSIKSVFGRKPRCQRCFTEVTLTQDADKEEEKTKEEKKK
jgi:hypothetical protein